MSTDLLAYTADTKDTPVDTGYGRRVIIARSDRLLCERLQRSVPGKIRLRLLRRLVPEPHTIVDVGMHVGLTTLEYGSWAKRVVGFEPDPASYRRALFNILGAKHCTEASPWWRGAGSGFNAQSTSFNVALGNTTQTSDLLCLHVPTGRNHIADWRAQTICNRPKTPVAVKRMDHYAIPNVSVIRIDVEGFELPVLYGAEQTIVTNRPVLQIALDAERARRYGIEMQTICDWLYARNYAMLLADQKLTVAPREYDPMNGMVDRFFVPVERLHHTAGGTLCTSDGFVS